MERWEESPEGTPVQLGVDVAAYGSDKTVIAVRKGNKLTELNVYSQKNTRETTGLIQQHAREHNTERIAVDEIGIGRGVVDSLEEYGYSNVGVNVSERSTDPERYHNLRAELWWNFRELLDPDKEPVSLPPDDELLSELASVKYKIDSRGAIQIESKEDMKKRLGHSPDRADAAVLAFSNTNHEGFAESFGKLYVDEKEKAMQKCKQFVMDIAPYTNNIDVHNILIALRKYFPKEWLSGLFEFSRKGPSQIDTVEEVLEHHNILFNPRTGFYEYRDKEHFSSDTGIWKKVDDEIIQGYIMNVLGKFATGGKLSSILKLIQSHHRVHSELPIRDFNSKPLIAFTNGTLHIDPLTGKPEFKPHSPYDYVTVRLPFRYDPNTKFDDWEKFIDQITNGDKDAQKVLQEFVGYIMLPNCRFQKALLLKGGGSNGKSVFLNVVSALFGGIGHDGDSYVSQSEMAKWVKDFRLMPLRYSMVNISSDAENDMRGAEGIFKKVVSGEVLEDSYKHKDPIPFKTRSKLIMACNYFPTINDTSDGFMRRWLIVELPMHFVKRNKVRPFFNDRELDPFIEDKLLMNLSGIFNWALLGLQRLLEQKQFTETRNQNALINEFRAVNNLQSSQ